MATWCRCAMSVRKAYTVKAKYVVQVAWITALIVAALYVNWGW